MIPSFRDSVTAELKCILLNNFCVCGPTSVKPILLLVSKVSNVSQNSGQEPITPELCPSVGFQNLKCISLNNCYVCGLTSVNFIHTWSLR